MTAYKNRIRNLERKMNMNNNLKFSDLLRPEYTYKGKPFEHTKQIFKHFKIKDAPEYFTNAELEILYKNGLLRYSIEQVLKAMQENL